MPLAVTSSDSSWFSRSRGSFLLLSLLLYIGLIPFIDGYVRLRLLNDIAFMMILLSAIGALSQSRRQTVAAILLALPMALSIWLTYLVSLSGVGYLALGFSLLFIGYTIAVLIRFIFLQRCVGQNVICAALSVYLLMGIFWAIVFTIAARVHPEAFSLPSVPSESTPYRFVYFSFTTLTTLGYGDIYPIIEIVRSFTILEAVLGQLYLAVIIARLVGMQISQSNAQV